MAEKRIKFPTFDEEKKNDGYNQQLKKKSPSGLGFYNRSNEKQPSYLSESIKPAFNETLDHKNNAVKDPYLSKAQS